MQRNWWDEDDEVAAPAAVAPILGAPKQPAPRYADDATRAANAAAASAFDPAKAEADAAAAQARAAQAPLDARRAAAEARKSELELQALERKAADPTGALGVEQSKATGFYSRGLKANEAYEAIGLGAEPLSLRIGKALTPEDYEGYIKTDERARADANIRAFIASVLRYESGAAIPPEEFSSAYKTYFPAPGEGPDVVAEKKRLRSEALEALALGSGPGAARVQPPADGRLDDDAFAAELRNLIRRKDRDAVIAFLKEQGRDVPDKGQLDAAIAAGDASIHVGKNDPQPPGRGVDPLASSHPGFYSFGVGLGDVVEGAGDILGIVANPLNTTINTVFGTRLPTDAGQTLRNFVGLPEPINDQQRLVGAINKGGVSALGLGGIARAGAPLATGVVENALSRFGSMPAQDAVAGMSGGGSAEVARQNGVGPVGQVVAGLAGGLATVPVVSAFGALAPGRNAAPAMNALARAGQEEGVDVARAMADPRLQNRVTGVEATMAGGPIVRGAMNRIGDQIEGRVRALGRGGEALETNVAGQKVIGASERFIKDSGKKAGRMYDAAEKAAGDAKVTPATSLQTVDDAIARLSETANTNASEISFLQGLKSDLSKDLSVGALRDMRTTLRQKISKGELTFGQNEARVLSIMDAASADIAAGLRAQGKGKAAKLFEQADRNYRERMDFISGTIQKLIGKRNANLSPEKVFSNLQGMASPKGDEAGLARMLRAMEPEEQADIAATFAEALGRNNKGEFSTAHFLSQAKKLPRAAQMNLFGAEGVRSLDNLRTLAKEHARVMGGLNHSRTGVANDWRSWMGSIVFGGGTGIATTSPTTGTAVALGTAALKSGRDVLSARALMNTDVNRWIRTLPRTDSAAAMRQHASRLSSIAAKNPAIASEIQGLQSLIARAMNDNVRAAAASGPEQEDQSDR